MQKDPWLRILIILLVVIAASHLGGLVWTIATGFADILLLVVLAWVVAFALEPAAHFLETRIRIRRGAAVAIVYLGLLVVLGLATVLVIPVIALQASQIGVNLPMYVENVLAWAERSQGWLLSRGIELDTTAIFDYREMARRVETIGPIMVNNALAIATGIAAVLFSLVLVLILSFYIMLDGSRLLAAFLRTLPGDQRDYVGYLFYCMHSAFGGYIRGQLIQAGVYGTGTATIMLAAGLDYTAFAASFAFAIMMIPFIGPVLAIIPPVAISVLVYPERAWWVFLLLLLLQQLVLNVLAPKVLSMSVGMHPLLVVLSLLTGAKLAGVWGAIFAVPVAGVIVAMVAFYRMTVEEREHRFRELSNQSPSGSIDACDLGESIAP